MQHAPLVDPQVSRVLRKALENDGGLYVDDDDNPEEKFPGISRAVKMRLMRLHPGSGWSDGTKYHLTRAGFVAIGEEPPLSIFGAIKKMLRL